LPSRVPSGSARSLLLTVLGEFVLPAGRPVWTATLVDVLAGLGVENTAARQALARTAADGWISAERIGRRTRWGLTGSGRRLLSDGARRIYGFEPSASSWDGRWLVLVVSVPERLRPARHVIRTRLAWAGFGSPVPGVWVCAHAGREAEAKQILAELGIVEDVYSFVGPFAGLGSATELVHRAWDLEAVAGHYRAFVTDFAGAAPGAGTPTVLAQARLVHAWRRMPLLDPRLPADLLPPDWVGHAAADLFHARHDEWAADAQATWTRAAG